MIGPVILDLHAALADVSAVSERLDSVEASPTPNDASEQSAHQDMHLYAITRSPSGTIAMGHVSHSSHSSHSSGTSHYSHGSHSSHTSHASHASGSHIPGPPPPSSPPPSSPPSAAAHGQPDLRIGAVGGALHGDNVYGSAKRQTVEQAGRRGARLSWQISVQNDAKVADRIRLRGAKSGHGFTVQYVAADGTNVTREVEAGTFQTPRLAHGATYRLTVVVQVSRQASPRRALNGKVEAFSVLTPTRTDTVAFVAHRG